MRIDRAYQPVETLGPGKRLVVWVQGCSKRCKHCSNPELWSFEEGQDIPEETLAQTLIHMAQQAGISRITFTGGDPLEQPQAFMQLLRRIRPVFDDVLVYTGYSLAESQRVLNEIVGEGATSSGSESTYEATGFEVFTHLVDALIDGPYIHELNNGQSALRGSTNQTLHVFNTALQSEYDRALEQPRRVQNVVFGDRSLSIGIHAT